MEKKNKFVFVVTPYGGWKGRDFGFYEDPFDAFVACSKIGMPFEWKRCVCVRACPLNRFLEEDEDKIIFATWGNNYRLKSGELDLDKLSRKELLELKAEDFKKSCQYREYMEKVDKLLNSNNENNGEAE